MGSVLHEYSEKPNYNLKFIKKVSKINKESDSIKLTIPVKIRELMHLADGDTVEVQSFYNRKEKAVMVTLMKVDQ